LGLGFRSFYKTQLNFLIHKFKLVIEKPKQGFKILKKNIFTQISKYQASHILDLLIFKGGFQK